jgi:hypothetical protein
VSLLFHHDCISRTQHHERRLLYTARRPLILVLEIISTDHNVEYIAITCWPTYGRALMTDKVLHAPKPDLHRGKGIRRSSDGRPPRAMSMTACTESFNPCILLQGLMSEMCPSIVFQHTAGCHSVPPRRCSILLHQMQ